MSTFAAPGGHHHCGGAECGVPADPNTYHPEAGIIVESACWCGCEGCVGETDMESRGGQPIE